MTEISRRCRGSHTEALTVCSTGHSREQEPGGEDGEGLFRKMEEPHHLVVLQETKMFILLTHLGIYFVSSTWLDAGDVNIPVLPRR